MRPTKSKPHATTGIQPITFRNMRIIAGEHRGRLLTPPKGDATRPITDRAKQSIFDVLHPFIEQSVVYDCFCGTGSMGLECLSRGAKQAYFFDADRHALTGLKQNIAALKVENCSKVVAGDIFRLVRSVPDQADLIFLDPPYRYLVEKPEPLITLAFELSKNHASTECQLIFRHDSSDKLALAGWTVDDVRTYGTMTIEIMHRDNV